MSVRRMLPFIFINIIVSATVVLAILFWWDNRQSDSIEATAIAITPPPRVISQATIEATQESQESIPQAVEGENLLAYEVQKGDSLGLISQQFDVLLIDLMEINGITDANIVTEGQTLIIPVIVDVTPTPIPTETPSFDTIPTPIPTLPSEGEVVVEIIEVVSPGNLNEERLAVVNSGERQIDLSNWTLEDEQGNVFVFGAVTLFGNGVELIVHTRLGQSGLLDQFWGLNEAIWEEGESAVLRDAEGTIRATYLVSDS
jgi:LysM repeat protein